MTDTLRETIRERMTLGSVLAWSFMAGIFWLVSDGAVVTVVLVLVLLLGIDAIGLLSDVYGFSPAIKPLVIGIVGLSGIGVILYLESGAMFDEPGGNWQFVFFAALAVAACWILFDAVRRLRREGV